MASLKELKGRINSVKSTQKITKAKQMVAAAKLRKAQASAEAARPYAVRLAQVVASLAATVLVGESSPPLLGGTGKDQVHLLVVANSDRGLCGAFNANIVKAAKLKANTLLAEGKTVLFYLVGRKGRPPIRREYPNAILGMFDTTGVREPGFDEAEGITNELLALFAAGRFDVAHLIYGKFRSALVQEPTVQQIIPVPTPTAVVSANSFWGRSRRIRTRRRNDPGRIAAALFAHATVWRAAGKRRQRTGRVDDRDGQCHTQCRRPDQEIDDSVQPQPSGRDHHRTY